MRIAIPNWGGRVSPVFDSAVSLFVLNAEEGCVVSRETVDLKGVTPFARARELMAAGPNLLICGAISWPLEAAVRSSGIRVIPQVCGDVEEGAAAFLAGGLEDRRYRLPGCRGGGWRRRGRHRRGRLG